MRYLDELFDVLGGTGQVTDTLWAASDHLGSVGELLDNVGDVVEHREYDSFCALDTIYEELGGTKTPSQMLSEVAHAGSLWDDAAGLYQKRARWYDPNTGRFLGEDPAQDGTNHPAQPAKLHASARALTISTGVPVVRKASLSISTYRKGRELCKSLVFRYFRNALARIVTKRVLYGGHRCYSASPGASSEH